MWTPINPVKALYWSAVLNGFVAVPVMIVMMIMSGQKRVMGQFPVIGWLRWLGWAATMTMALCAAGLVASWLV
jgi:Mn2+/Fe2+ NRAMP family transporter